MLEATDRARKELGGLQVRWCQVERAGEPKGDLPDPETVVAPKSAEELSDEPVADAYRSLFWALDIDPTKQRPAGEALARRVLRDGDLPSIHPLVDAYNLASAATLVPISAFDLDRLSSELVLDLADEDERFDPIGGEPTKVEEGRPVWRDDEGVVSLTGYRDGQRTALRAESEEAILVGVGPRAAGPRVLPEAFRLVEQYISVAGWRMVTSPKALQL